MSRSQRAVGVAAVVETRRRAHSAYTPAARRGERFTHLFASGQITVWLIHAASRSAGHPLKPRMEER
ncbi:hypothetical protein [Streptosporangium sp. NPDC001681]|uniref:hypothetical protein n=1 Tax=Streptosporangium sp. NPDC001681 TaxID=3154395 RepID=UPI003323638B